MRARSPSLLLSTLVGLMLTLGAAGAGAEEAGGSGVLGKISQVVGPPVTKAKNAVENTRPVKAVKRFIGKNMPVAQGYMTLAGDKIEARLPKEIAAKVHGYRPMMNPISFVHYVDKTTEGQKGKFAGVFIGDTIVSDFVMPMIVGMAAGPAAAAAWEVTGGQIMDPLILLGAYAVSQYKQEKKVNPKATFAGTLRKMAKDYHHTARIEQTKSRAFMQQRAMKNNTNGARAPLGGRVGAALRAVHDSFVQRLPQAMLQGPTRGRR